MVVPSILVVVPRILVVVLRFLVVVLFRQFTIMASAAASKQCDRCGNKYQSQKALNYHLRIKHPKPMGKLTSWWTLPRCRTCGGKTFSCERVLIRHMATLHGAGAAAKAKCHACNKVFSRQNSIKRHLTRKINSYHNVA